MPQGERLKGVLRRLVELACRPLKQPPEQLRIGGIGLQPCQQLLVEHLCLTQQKVLVMVVGQHPGAIGNDGGHAGIATPLETHRWCEGHITQRFPADQTRTRIDTRFRGMSHAAQITPSG
jgi:hypothetical protein